jgi:hypothetical protein
MKAIETTYKGYRFRSRLEARWGVFFDALGIEWEYETQGFNLGDLNYLPDFWLPTINVWFEVKGGTVSGDDLAKMDRLRCESFPVVLAKGNIGDQRLTAYGIDSTDSGGGCSEWENCEWCFCLRHNCWSIDFQLSDNRTYFGHADWSQHAGCCLWPARAKWEDSRLTMAYGAARAARFEHGESPRERATVTGRRAELSQLMARATTESEKNALLHEMMQLVRQERSALPGRT